MKRKRLIAAGAVTGVLLVAIQLIPVHHTNPPGGIELEAPPEVTRILEGACFDCHSHTTRWPWYSHVAPVSWLVAHDVEEAREHVNFSTWSAYPPDRQQRLEEEMWEEIEEGEMPPGLYRLAHPAARLDQTSREVLRRWLSGQPEAEQ